MLAKIRAAIQNLRYGHASHICRRLERRGVPPALAKATVDQFDYALKLRNGRMYTFGEATVSLDCQWVTIRLLGGEYSHKRSDLPAEFEFPRGLDIRISEIVWVADAPSGS